MNTIEVTVTATGRLGTLGITTLAGTVETVEQAATRAHGLLVERLRYEVETRRAHLDRAVEEIDAFEADR